MSLRRSFVVLWSVSVALSGCAASWQPVRDVSMGGVPSQAMTADFRMVTLQANPKDAAKDGKRPGILCAEPSPDIARAFSNAFSAVASASVKSPTSTSVDASGGLQSQSAQAIAQLGKRFATLEILREKLYRECMAYANGQLSESTWALLESRFNSWVVTLLAVEVVSGDSATPPNPVTSPSLVVNNLGTGQAVANAASAPATAAPAASAASDPSGSASAPKASTVTTTAKSKTNSQNLLAAGAAKKAQSTTGTDTATRAETAASAPLTSTPSSTGVLASSQVAAIVQMQKAYLETEDLGPSLLACFTFLDPPDISKIPNPTNPLYGYCQKVFDARIADYLSKPSTAVAISGEELSSITDLFPRKSKYLQLQLDKSFAPIVSLPEQGAETKRPSTTPSALPSLPPVMFLPDLPPATKPAPAVPAKP